MQIVREIKDIEGIRSIAHTGNNHVKIDTLEELHITKRVRSSDMLNDVISGKNDPLAKQFPPPDNYTKTANARTSTANKSY